MKKVLSIFLVLALVGALAPVFPAGLTAAGDALAFDAEAAYLGRYTVEGNAAVPGTLVFDSYQVTYVTNPMTDEFSVMAGDPPQVSYTAADIHKMNIKVPVSYDGRAFSAAETDAAPILFYNPWGGDNGNKPPATDTVDVTGFNVKRLAMSQGWVLTEPGMRGINHTTPVETIGTEDYRAYGKLPEPIVDLKAALRYLHGNAERIFGDTEKIIATGSSSGGCATSVLGASGNTGEYDEYLARLGAADARDDVFMAAPSCPIITRDWSDSGSFWMRWGTELPEGTPAYNKELTDAFQTYQNGLGLTGTVNGVPDTPLTDYATYTDYLMDYIEKAIVQFLNHISVNGTNNAPGNPGVFVGGLSGVTLTGREAIEAYLASSKPADTLFGTPETARGWLKLVYDADNPNLVTGVENTFAEYIAYLAPGRSPMTAGRPMTDNPYWFEENVGENGVLADNSNAEAASATTRSMGNPNEYGAIFSDFGWDYIEREYGISVSDVYRNLITFQRNSVDPLHFILGGEAVDIAPHWFIRSGSNDGACVLPLMFNMAAALEMKDKNVNVGVAWDQGHAYTQDVTDFISWAKAIIGEADAAALPAELPAAPPAELPAPADFLVDGKGADIAAYNIGGHNYYKLRDLAFVLNGTAKQFAFARDGAAGGVTITPGAAYTPDGSEMKGKGEGGETPTPSATAVFLGAEEAAAVAVYRVGADDYFRLRDIGQVLGFDVVWDEAAKVTRIDTTK